MTPLLAGHIKSAALPESELHLARASSASLSGLLAGAAESVSLRFTDPQTGEEVEVTVPRAALRMLAEALAQMGEGHSVLLAPLRAELSTQQAAELMGVSRSYFAKLLESGELPCSGAGEARRVRYHDLVRYLAAQRRSGVEAVSRMTSEAQELGLYE